MKKYFLLLVILAFSSLTNATQDDFITVYGYSKTRTPENPRVFDKFIMHFNQNVAPKIGFKLKYQRNVELIEEAYKKGADLLEGADIVEIKDIINIGHAREQNFFESLDSEVLNQNIPSHLRAKDNTWFAMNKRARVIYYDSRVVSPSELSTYEDLSNPKWKDKLCLRVSKKSYNKALVSFFIDMKGEDETSSMLESWVANNPIITKVDMAGSKPSELGVLQAIHEGRCKVGVANTYYLGFLEQRDGYKNTAIRAFFPNQNSYGTHINAASYGVLKSSKKKAMAQKFLEWMSSVEAQEFYTSMAHQFPVNPQAKLSPFLTKLGAFKENKTFNLERATTLKEDAFELMKLAGWSYVPTPVRTKQSAK